MKDDEFLSSDGLVRKKYYGEGRQPWDDIIDLGWGPQFAAGNALKYVRRYKAKNGEDDLTKGRWYFERLRVTAKMEGEGPWMKAFNRLWIFLTPEERTLLGDYR